MWQLVGLLFISILCCLCRSQAILAPYQVSIRSAAPAIVGNQPPGFSEHICSGVIIRDKYILTTASCVHVVDKQTRLTRPVNLGELFIVAGNLSVTSKVSEQPIAAGIRRNIISVIPHDGYNAATGDNDIALLKLDRSLPLHNTTSVQWIELQGPLPKPSAANATQLQPQQTTVATNNKVNENCFINIYNNSVGASNYPFTVVSNISYFDKWVCDAQRISAIGGHSTGRNGICVEYRFSDPQSCSLDPTSLKYSAERGTALVCNFKLAGILAEINPASSPKSCISINRTTAYYTPVGQFHDWIVTEIGYLYSTVTPTITGVVTSGGNGNAAQPIPDRLPASSWGNSQATDAAAHPGKPKSAAASVSSGTVSKLILFNLCIPLAFVYRLYRG